MQIRCKATRTRYTPPSDGSPGAFEATLEGEAHGGKFRADVSFEGADAIYTIAEGDELSVEIEGAGR